MKKSNNAQSKHKLKRAIKNKKRLSSKVQLSAFERKQQRIYEMLTNQSLMRMAAQQNINNQ